MKNFLFALCASLALTACEQEPDNHSDAHGNASPAACTITEHGAIEVRAPWVRTNSNIGGTSAAYFTLCNQSAQAVTLNGITSPVAGIAELHETTRTEDGVVSMKPVGGLVIAPGASIRFEPGGMHVMLLSLTQEIIENNDIDLEFEFSDGIIIATTAKAKPITHTDHSGH